MTRRPRPRTRVVGGVLSVTLLALVAFDIAAVGAMHRYLAVRTGTTRGHTIAPLLAFSAAMTGPVPMSLTPATLRLPALEHPVPKARAARAQQATRHAASPHAARVPLAGRVLLVRYWPVAVTGPSSGDLNAAVGRFRLMMILGSAAAGLLICAGVALITGRGLRPIEARAAQADRLKNDLAEKAASQDLMRSFFANASHELRTPLASLRANAELYQQGALRRRPQVDEAMRRIALEARRMSSLVDDMLRLARLEHSATVLPGQHEPSGQHEPVDLARLVEDRVANARFADPARHWHADVTGVREPVAGEEELLRRAVDNLLANVRTHTPPGTRARVTARTGDRGVTIEVRDNGPGVAAGQLPHVFDRFHRAGAPASRPGSGLGLSIVAEIAAVHGGVAEAALADPHGLRVTLTLPVTRTPPGNELLPAITLAAVDPRPPV